jgi:hypothetical protein
LFRNSEKSEPIERISGLRKLKNLLLFCQDDTAQKTHLILPVEICECVVSTAVGLCTLLHTDYTITTTGTHNILFKNEYVTSTGKIILFYLN